MRAETCSNCLIGSDWIYATSVDCKALCKHRRVAEALLGGAEEGAVWAGGAKVSAGGAAEADRLLLW